VCCVFYLRFFNYMLCCMCCVHLSCWIKITYLLTYQSLAVYLLLALPVGCGHHWTTVAVLTVTRHRTALTRFHDSLTSEISYDFCQIIWKQSSYWEEINGLTAALHPTLASVARWTPRLDVQLIVAQQIHNIWTCWGWSARTRRLLQSGPQQGRI